MTQTTLNRKVARATGESLATIRRRGFSLACPDVVLFDPDHSDEEDRELLIGHSNVGRLLFVSYTLRGTDTRIISARRATQREAEIYAQGI